MEQQKEWRNKALRNGQRNEQESSSMPIGLDLLCWAITQANIRIEEGGGKEIEKEGEQEEEEEQRRETIGIFYGGQWMRQTQENGKRIKKGKRKRKREEGRKEE
jgi:hypothetical protein